MKFVKIRNTFMLVAVMAVIPVFLSGCGVLQTKKLETPDPSPYIQNSIVNQQEPLRAFDEDYQDRFTAVNFTANMDRLREQMMRSNDGKVRMMSPAIPPEQYIAFSESEYLGGSVLIASIGVNSTNTIRVVDEHLGGGVDRPMLGFVMGANTEIPQFMMSLQANQFKDFKNGSRSIAEGRMPENLNECIVSTDLAKEADLSVGDTLSLTSYLEDTDKNRLGIEYRLTIVGTYHDITREYADDSQKNAYTNRRNEILTNFKTVTAPIKEGFSGAKLGATYYLKNPEMLDVFAEEVYAKGLDPIYDVVYAGK